MNNNMLIKIGYDVVFYNTIGLMDEVLIRMVKDLLEIGDEYQDIFVFRNDKKYSGCPLVLSFDNELFVDVRLHFDNRCGMMEKHIFESMGAFVTILDNTYSLREDQYRYVMLDLTRLDSGLLYDVVQLESINSGYSTYVDNWKLVYYDCSEALTRLSKEIDIKTLDRNIRWSALMEATSFEELDHIIDNDLLSIDEKEELYAKLKDVNNNNDIIAKVDKIVELEDEYLYIYDVASKEAVYQYQNNLVRIMLDKGISKDIIISILGVDDAYIKNVEKIRNI